MNGLANSLKPHVRLRLVLVKAFPENIAFPERKMYSGVWLPRNRFTENKFWCLVRTNILRKMTSVLRKINSHVWFGQTFYGKWNSFLTEN